ncbi:hypothetical protein V6Z11_D03G040400 [Gossypium hirsutum]
MADLAFLFHSNAFCLILCPLSPSIISLTRASTSLRFTSGLISIPLPHVKGQQIKGTPSDTASNREFHPQCVKKTPTAGWDNTCCWGHQLIMRPLPFIASMNSLGKIADSPITTSGLTTHKNGYLLFASPQANSSK